MDRDDGFTLIELITVIVILGIVIGAMTGAMIVGIRTTNATIQRLSESHDAQNSTAYFVADMQSAVTTTMSDNQCDEGESVLVSFRWTDYGDSALSSTDDEDRIATYVTKSDAQIVEDETGELIQEVVTVARNYCTRSGSAPYSLSETTRIASLVSPASGPQVACVPAGCVLPPDNVEITATEASGFEFRLSARRRSAKP